MASWRYNYTEDIKNTHPQYKYWFILIDGNNGDTFYVECSDRSEIYRMHDFIAATFNLNRRDIYVYRKSAGIEATKKCRLWGGNPSDGVLVSCDFNDTIQYAQCYYFREWSEITLVTTSSR